MMIQHVPQGLMADRFRQGRLSCTTRASDGYRDDDNDDTSIGDLDDKSSEG